MCKIKILALFPLLFFTVCFTATFSVYAVGNDIAKKRAKTVNTIVLHSIGGPKCKNGKVVFTGSMGSAKKWKKYFEESKDVSIHYIVDRDGKVAASISEDKIAWHAKGRNSRSIGIELTNNGDGIEKYPELLLTSLKKLVVELKSKHPDITNTNIVKHSEIDNSTFTCAGKEEKRKRDPGPKFPYAQFIKSL